MSRSYHQHHPAHVGKRARKPRPERARKHKPYGYKTSRYENWLKDMLKKYSWFLDSQERWQASDVQNKSMARREGKEEIERQLEDDENFTRKAPETE